MSTRSQLTKDLNGLSSTECLRSYYGTVIHKKNIFLVQIVIVIKCL